MTKIIIVDDHQLFREGVKRILDFEDTFEVVAEGDDGTDVINLYSAHKSRRCTNGYQHAREKWCGGDC